MFPITGNTNKLKSVNCGFKKNKEASVPININGEFKERSTRLPRILFSTSLTSLDILDIRSPFLCSEKEKIQEAWNLSVHRSSKDLLLLQHGRRSEGKLQDNGQCFSERKQRQ